MRLFIPTLVALVTAAACTTATVPDDTEEVALRGKASTTCVTNKNWAYAVNRGEFVYENTCDYCHQDNGKGQPGMVPSLAGNDNLIDSPERGIRLIMATKAHAKPGNRMEADELVAIFDELSNADIADVLTYARASWGNCASPVSEADVAAIAADM